VVVPLPRLEAAGDATASATVVEAARFEGEAKGVAELVATAPGVAVNGYGGLGKLATASIRGSSADAVTVLLDGLVLNTAFGGGVDLSTIPRHWIDRIEVVRGAEGARYGAGAMGGVVNVVTRRAVAGAWSAQAAGGSFGTFMLSGDAAAGGEGWSGLAAASLDATAGDFPFLYDRLPSAPGNPLTPGIRENNAGRLGGLLLKGDWRALGGRFDALAQLSAARRQLPGSVSGQGWPRHFTPNDRQDDGRAVALVRHAHRLGEGLSLSAEISGRVDRLDAVLEDVPGGARQRGAAAGLRSEVTWLHGPGILSAGASAEVERIASESLGGARSRPDLAAWIAEDVTFLGARLRVGPALRAERVGAFAGLSGKLGATARLWGPFTARASAGRTFRAPSVAELYLEQGLLQPNPDLRPESAWSADAAVAAEGPAGFASAGAFASLYQDLIVYEPGTGQRLKPFNDAKASFRGLEIEAASAPLRELLGLSASVAYTFLRSETLRGGEQVLGKEVSHRPRHRLYARLGVEGARAGAHAEAHWVSLQYQDAQNLVVIPETWLFSAGAFVRVLDRPDARLALEVKNLLDDRTLQDGFGNPLPSRTVMVTVSLAQEGTAP
jgi:iron complex outermembrane receptor protein